MDNGYRQLGLVAGCCRLRRWWQDRSSMVYSFCQKVADLRKLQRLRRTIASTGVRWRAFAEPGRGVVGGRYSKNYYWIDNRFGCLDIYCDNFCFNHFAKVQFAFIRSKIISISKSTFNSDILSKSVVEVVRFCWTKNMMSKIPNATNAIVSVFLFILVTSTGLF